MVNQHEIDTADIIEGEQVGWLDRNDEQHYGIVERLPEATNFGAMFHINEEGVTKPVRLSRVNWREII